MTENIPLPLARRKRLFYSPRSALFALYALAAPYCPISTPPSRYVRDRAVYPDTEEVTPLSTSENVTNEDSTKVEPRRGSAVRNTV